MSKKSKSDFEGQREGERVMLVFRRHRIAMRKGFFLMLVMIALGVLPMVIRPDDVKMFWIFLGLAGIGLLGMLYTLVLWYFSIYIVTNQRIRQIRQKGLFKRTVVDLSLDKIQSIAYNVPGVKAGIMGYGTILIQTGAGNLTISLVPKPAKIYNRLQNISNGGNGFDDDIDEDDEGDDEEKNGELILDEI